MPDPPADKIELLNACDNFAGLRAGLRRVASTTDAWAGIPMPLDTLPLTIEPSFPDAEILATIGGRGQKPEPADPELEGAKILNEFWSWRRRCTVVIWRLPDGRIDWGLRNGANHLAQDLEALDASVAWGIEQEGAAVRLLGTMLRHHAFKKYLLTGMFVENSERSGITYIFRRLKPTVALSTRPIKGVERTKILCALCLHPIAYYGNSWAGAMCPTDDVIAHLVLMRGDEAMFWRRANQHPPWRPEAGL